MNPRRVRILLGKELIELRSNLPAILPALLVGIMSIVVPVLVVFLVPWALGESLARDADLRAAAATAARQIPALRTLSPDGAVQAFLLHQFLLLLILTPVACAMSLASYSVVGEKQNRTLEPLLATPLTTLELLLGKVLGAFLPAVALEAAALALYGALIGWLAEPGVLRTFLSPGSLLVVGTLGPFAALVALQLAVLVSSRVSDPRSAQQIGVLVIAPLVGLGMAQLLGVFWLTPGILLALAAGLLLIWCGLMCLGIRVFDRENVLTRWR